MSLANRALQSRALEQALNNLQTEFAGGRSNVPQIGRWRTELGNEFPGFVSSLSDPKYQAAMDRLRASWATELGVRMNSALWSRDLTNGVWVTTNGTAALNAVGLDGTPNSASTITDNNAAARTTVAQNITVPNDLQTHSVSFWIAKDASPNWRRIGANISGGTAVNRQCFFNSQTGVIASQQNSGQSTFRVVDGATFGLSAWWFLEFTLTNNQTGNTVCTPSVIPCFSATNGGAEDVTLLGSIVIGHMQVELGCPFASSPIFTTSAPVTAPAVALF